MAWLVVRAETFEFGFWYLCAGVCLRVCFLTCFWVMLGVVGFRGWVWILWAGMVDSLV